MIGCSTETDQMIYITNMVFLCQFFNTGILPMLLTANLEGQLPPAIVKMFGLKGSSRDFDQQWFIVVGDTIVQSMIINMVLPVMMEIAWLSLRKLFIFLD
jgi:hypothetical protein